MNTTTQETTMTTINITVTRYEGNDFPEAERYTEWLAERVAEDTGVPVEVEWGQTNRVHNADLDLAGYWEAFCSHGYREYPVTATITVADDGTPSTCYPAEEQEKNGAMDYTVSVRVGGKTIESSITLFRDATNGGMGHCGTPLDGWCADPIVKWVHTLDRDSRRDVLAALANGPGTYEVEVKLEPSPEAA